MGKILTVIGARPQFVKAAPICAALARRGLEEVLVHTGQHHDVEMSGVFFSELDIPEPRYNLAIHGGSHGAMTGRMLVALERVVEDERPSLVMVYGDTNSTLAGALAAAKLRVPVAHVEAGLRSFNRGMPEEINRVLTDHVSELLLCPTHIAVANLAREGIIRKVHHVGDVMYDATLLAKQIAMHKSSILEDLDLQEGGYCVMTLHRAENTATASHVAMLVDYVIRQAKSRAVVFPVHPRTQNVLLKGLTAHSGLKMIKPVGYIDMTRLLAGAALVFTDSGGLQKECYFHRVRCITLRRETEWIETVEAGWNRLWKGPGYAPQRDISDYGDGHAAEAVADILMQYREDPRALRLVC